MSLSKNERLMNLLFLLMSTRQYLTRAQIKEALEVYRDIEGSAFERKFERDKDDLRELGIEIQTGSHDPLAPQNEGYRIERRSIELPDLAFTREEAAVVGLAGQVWHNSAMTAAVTTGLAKLQSGGMTVDTSAALGVPVPTLGDDPYFEVLADAVRTRTAVSFGYTDARGECTNRELEPWGMLLWQDRWYVGGHDRGRGQARLFRLSRISSPPRLQPRGGSFDVPEDADLTAVATLLFPPEPDREATLLVSRNRGHRLRRRARAVVDHDEQRDRLSVPFADTAGFAAEIATLGPDALVVEPTDLRDAVVAHLGRVMAS